MDRIGVVDTMFARYDMGAEALDELKQCPGFGSVFEVVHRTVPGFKDLAVECKRIIEDEGCRIVVALGMPGKADIDQVCAHEASQGIMQAQLMTSTHILEVFVHEAEEEDPADWPRCASTGPASMPATPTGCSTSPSSWPAGPARACARDTRTPGPSRPETGRGRSGRRIVGQAQVRSAMMFRCTCDVPPPMVRAGAKRYPKSQRPPGHGAPSADPALECPVGRLGALEHAPGAGEVAGQGHHVLTVLVGQRLAHRRLGAGLGAGQRRRHRPQPEQPEDLTLGPQPGQALAVERVGRAPGSSHRVDQVGRGGPHPPQGPGPGQRDPLVAQGHLGQRPPLAPGADQVVRPGSRTSSRKTSLKVWVPVMSTRGRTRTPGASIGQMK